MTSRRQPEHFGPVPLGRKGRRPGWNLLATSILNGFKNILTLLDPVLYLAFGPGFLHFFPRLTRRVFFVHNFFIGLTVVLGGPASFFCVNARLRPDALSRAVPAGMATFWFCRLLAQFVAYDSNLARRSVSHLHARSVLLAVVLRYSDIWNRVPNRKELTIYRIEAEREFWVLGRQPDMLGLPSG